MYLRTRTMGSINDCSQQIKHLKDVLEKSDRVVIGAGAGLSVSAGFVYSGERFRKYFSDFEKKYGFHDMYSGGFYPFETREEFWAYWSRYIYVNRYIDAPKPVYNDLFETVKNKDYFVITTNVDHCFQKAGFDKKRLFYTQGDYGLFQCSEPCCNETFDNEKIIRQMYEHRTNMSVPSELIPKCPHCGKPMTMNLRSDDTFVEDGDWHIAAKRYSDFIRAGAGHNTLFLELGVGMNTPGIIKYPFWKMTENDPNAFYVCINYGEAHCPREIEQKSICIDGDIGDIVARL